MNGSGRMLAIAGAVALLTACVTINVYFPAAAAERAADTIIEEVWGEGAGGVQPAPEPQSRASGVGLALLELLVPAARAQADFDISTPAIDRLKASMKERFEALRPYYESGAVGLTADGLVTVRDPKLVPLAERNRVQALVAAENRDRNALYAEIARANGHPEWEAEIRETFARRWVANARSGWWYRSGGGWRQKP